MQSSNNNRSYYQVLEISPSATLNEIKIAFKKKALQYHPDRNMSVGAKAEFQLISESYEVLSNSRKRTVYDMGRRSGEEYGRRAAANVDRDEAKQRQNAADREAKEEKENQRKRELERLLEEKLKLMEIEQQIREEKAKIKLAQTALETEELKEKFARSDIKKEKSKLKDITEKTKKVLQKHRNAQIELKVKQIKKYYKDEKIKIVNSNISKNLDHGLNSETSNIPFYYKSNPGVYYISRLFKEFQEIKQDPNASAALRIIRDWILAHEFNSQQEFLLRDFCQMYAANMLWHKYNFSLEMTGSLTTQIEILIKQINEYFLFIATEKQIPVDFSLPPASEIKNLELAIQFCKRTTRQDEIENFFGEYLNAKNLDEKSAKYKLLLDENFKNKVHLDDDTIMRLIKTTTADGVLDLNQYQISRIFLHAIITPPEKWTPTFGGKLAAGSSRLEDGLLQQVIKLIENIDSVQQEEKAGQIKRENYPDELLTQLKHSCEEYRRSQWQELSDEKKAVRMAGDVAKDIPRPEYVILTPEQVKTGDEWLNITSMIKNIYDKNEAEKKLELIYKKDAAKINQLLLTVPIENVLSSLPANQHSQYKENFYQSITSLNNANLIKIFNSPSSIKHVLEKIQNDENKIDFLNRLGTHVRSIYVSKNDYKNVPKMLEWLPSEFRLVFINQLGPNLLDHFNSGAKLAKLAAQLGKEDIRKFLKISISQNNFKFKNNDDLLALFRTTISQPLPSSVLQYLGSRNLLDRVKNAGVITGTLRAFDYINCLIELDKARLLSGNFPDYLLNYFCSLKSNSSGVTGEILSVFQLLNKTHHSFGRKFEKIIVNSNKILIALNELVAANVLSRDYCDTIVRNADYLKPLITCLAALNSAKLLTHKTCAVLLSNDYKYSFSTSKTPPWVTIASFIEAGVQTDYINQSNFQDICKNPKIAKVVFDHLALLPANIKFTSQHLSDLISCLDTLPFPMMEENNQKQTLSLMMPKFQYANEIEDCIKKIRQLYNCPPDYAFILIDQPKHLPMINAGLSYLIETQLLHGAKIAQTFDHPERAFSMIHCIGKMVTKLNSPFYKMGTHQERGQVNFTFFDNKDDLVLIQVKIQKNIQKIIKNHGKFTEKGFEWDDIESRYPHKWIILECLNLYLNRKMDQETLTLALKIFDKYDVGLTWRSETGKIVDLVLGLKDSFADKKMITEIDYDSLRERVVAELDDLKYAEPSDVNQNKTLVLIKLVAAINALIESNVNNIPPMTESEKELLDTIFKEKGWESRFGASQLLFDTAHMMARYNFPALPKTSKR